MTLHSKVLIITSFIFFGSCTKETNEVIVNESGRYSIEVLPEWSYSTDNSSTTIVRAKSLVVEATLSISIIESEYETLSESFSEYVAQLPPGFQDYASLGNGNTQINGIPAMWHGMKDTENGNRFRTLVYVMQQVGNEMIVISCSSLDDTFDKYEEDFTKMAFTFSKLEK